MTYTDWDMDSQGMRNIKNALRRAGTLFGDRNAYEWKSGGSLVSVTFRRLREDSEALGTALAARDAFGARIAVCGGNSYEWALAYITALGVGVAVPLSEGETAAGLACVCQKAEVTLAFADEGKAADFPDGVEVFTLRAGLSALLDEGRALIAAGDTRYTAAATDDAAVCEILFNSPASAERRGAMLSHKNIMSVVCSDFPFLMGLRSLCVLPFSLGFEAVCQLLSALMPGATLCIASSPRRFAAELSEFEAASAYIVPLIAEELLGRLSPMLDLAKSLNTLVCGGAALPAGLEEAFEDRDIRLMNGYYLSECSPLVSLNTNGAAGSVGQTPDYCVARVIYPDGDGDGELEIYGENVMQGYCNDPEGTRAAITEDNWVRTGDMGRFDFAGNLYISGKQENLIRLPSGKRVMPEELEARVAQYLPMGAQLRVFAERNRLTVEAYCAGRGDFASALRTAVEKANELLPRYKRITDIKIVAQPFPKTALGEIIRR
ncbi:MAG: AMP-binding protein [Oscillospiraceae bacterium]